MSTFQCECNYNKDIVERYPYNFEVRAKLSIWETTARTNLLNGNNIIESTIAGSSDTENWKVSQERSNKHPKENLKVSY